MINSIFSVDEISVTEEDEMNKYTMGIILGFLGAGLNLPASANQVIEQAPIVFEYNLTGPAIVESEPIVASGTIKTISVFAESVGQVSLEVSTNGGSTYTKIINGSLLVDGFIPGNQLRFKTDIAQESSLKKLVIMNMNCQKLARCLFQEKYLLQQN